MSRLFLSHSSADNREAVALKQWLGKQNPRLANEIFLDLDPGTGIYIGQRWREALNRAATLLDAIAKLGSTCKAKLAGPGESEAAIRAPIKQLLADAGTQLSLTVVPHDAVRDSDRGVRPDYAISVNGAITGYVEVKKPGANLDPESFTGHNRTQSERQRDLPNSICR